MKVDGKLDKFEHKTDWQNWVGKDVRKHSGKPFKSGNKVGTPQSMTVNPNSGKDAFMMDDSSVVDCHQCLLN